MKINLSAEYIDTCLPDYLQDGHTREGETLLLCVPYGQSVAEAAQELLDSMDCDCGLPEECEDEEILAVLRQTLGDVDIDLRYINANGDRVDEGPEDDEDWGDTPYVYVVLRWEVEEEDAIPTTSPPSNSLPSTSPTATSPTQGPTKSPTPAPILAPVPPPPPGVDLEAINPDAPMFCLRCKWRGKFGELIYARVNALCPQCRAGLDTIIVDTNAIPTTSPPSDAAAEASEASEASAESEVEVVVIARAGAGKTTVAGLIYNHLKCCGLQVELEDEGMDEDEVQQQAYRSLHGGFIHRTKVRVSTRAVLKSGKPQLSLVPKEEDER